MMRNFIAAVLSVIAVGVMVIAYALFNPRVATADAYPSARPMLASERVGLIEDGYAPYSRYTSASAPPAMAYPVNDVRAIPASETYPAPRRDWTKTAMVIGGTTAAGAGLGAIFGGKKGALIGAAIGGGAGTIYEVRKR
jgi:hypothetical protein